MGCQPTLNTPRLILRPFTLADAPELQRLANAPEIAATTLHIPHPYPQGMAEIWIKQHPEMFETGQGAVRAGRGQCWRAAALAPRSAGCFGGVGGRWQWSGLSWALP